MSAKKKALPIAAEVRRWRVIGVFPRGSAPLGVSDAAPFDGSIAAGDAIWCAPDPSDVDAPFAVSERLPDAATVAGALLVVAGTIAKPGLLSRLLGAETKIARSVRGSALLLRGYRDVGGGVDPASGLDLAWGRASLP